MVDFLATMGMLFWVGIGTIIALVVLLELEFEGWVTSIVSVCLGIAIYYNHSAMWDYMNENFLTIIGFGVFYIVVGIVWSFVKWQWYIKSKLRPFIRIKKLFVDKHGDIPTYVNGGDNTKMADFKHFYREEHGQGLYGAETLEEIVNYIVPNAYDEKGRLISWISYWPISIVGTLLNNPFRRLFEWIYNNVSGYYDKIGGSAKRKALS